MDRVRLIREFGHGFSLTPVPAPACTTLCAPPERDLPATPTFSTAYESLASAQPPAPSPLQSIVCASTTPPTPLDSVGCAILGGGGYRHVFNLRCETGEEGEGRGQRNGGNEQPHVCSHHGVSIPGSERAALDLSLRAVGAALRRPLWSAAARRRLAFLLASGAHQWEGGLNAAPTSGHGYSVPLHQTESRQDDCATKSGVEPPHSKNTGGGQA